MPALRNSRHEKFCQLYASGTSGAEAYRKAGYRDNWRNVPQLKAKKDVKSRIFEIQQEAAEQAKLTREGLIEEFRVVRDAAAEDKNWGAVNTAIKGRAVLSGHWVEKQEQRDTTDRSDLSYGELLADLMDFLDHVAVQIDDDEQ
jgi:phage terminase small subunit